MTAQLTAEQMHQHNEAGWQRVGLLRAFNELTVKGEHRAADIVLRLLEREIEADNILEALGETG